MNITIQPEVQQRAKAVFDEFGLSENQAIALFFEQVALKKKLPFPIKQKELFVMATFNEGIWTAECDALGLVTEADSYEELQKRAREIVPELAELNDVKNYKLRFIRVTG
jgi:addiction module RelB/DinJ family antitoxin